MPSYNKVQKVITKKQQLFIARLIIEIVKISEQINERIKKIITDTYEKYSLPKMLDGKPDAASTTAFMNEKINYRDMGKISRLNIMKIEIKSAVTPLLVKRDKLIELRSRVAYMNGYYWNAWAVQNAAKVKDKWPKVKPKEIDNAINENPLSVFKSKEI